MQDSALNQSQEKALLVGIGLNGQRPEEVEESIKELSSLADTAGAIVTQKIIQHVKRPISSTFIGSGKTEELSDICRQNQIDLVIFDHELTPAQQRNLEARLGTPVIDRPQLILDIFARRARSNEGKLQVELAQLKYMLPRLIGKGLALSRLGGGIGTRGPGETQLEVDRRKVRRRIDKLQKDLEQVKKRRRVQRSGRKSLQLPAIALVGYTNAGKSTLFNALTDSSVLTEDKLFSTLDPTIRGLSLPHGGWAIISDTVGFIRKLPHELVAAFKATLEEVVEADILLHVIDAASTQKEEQADAVRNILEEIEARDKPIIDVLNKKDLVKSDEELRRLLLRFEKGIPISAKYCQGLDGLLKAIQSTIRPVIRHVKCAIPYEQGKLISMIHDRGKVLHKEYRERDVFVEADVEIGLARALKPYEVIENKD